MRRPLIGITSYVERARWGVWDARAALIPYSYVQMVTEAGGRAVVLPPDPAGGEAVAALDALVLAGGADLGPDLYAAPAHPLTDPRPERDAGELPALRAALAANLPVLGLCRGMQLLAVAYGGALNQHLPDLLGHDKHRPAPGRFGRHGVRVAPGSLLSTFMDRDEEVNSYHHQGVADAGDLSVTARSDDGIIEAVEDPDRAFVLGVQWHPEEAADPRPFRALVRAAAVP